MSLKTDYKDYIPSTEYRHYQLINNSDSTVSLKDVTVYSQTGDLFSAADINATNAAINEFGFAVTTATLTSTGWTQQSDGTWRQTVSGITVTANQKVDFDCDVVTAASIPAQIRPYNENGTLYAVTTQKPTNAISVQCTIMNVQTEG